MIDYKKISEKIGRNALEELVKEALIPFIEEKVKDSTSPIDDVVFASIKPVLLEFADKIDGEDN